MHPQTHLLLSWTVGNRLAQRRDRALIAWAGVAPDVDGLTVLLGTDTYGRWHHVLTHGILAAVAVSLLGAALARRRLAVALGAFGAFHLHLLCDLFGSGTGWSLTYFYPFSDAALQTQLGWELASWQNVAVTAAVMVFVAWVGVRRGHTAVEVLLPRRADAGLVRILRRWARHPGARAPDGPPGDEPR